MDSKKPKHLKGHLLLEIIEAINVPQQDPVDTPDPYIKFRFDGVKHKTNVQKNTRNPKWNAKFTFHVNAIPNSLDLELGEHNLLINKLVASCTLNLTSLQHNQPVICALAMKERGAGGNGGAKCILKVGVLLSENRLGRAEMRCFETGKLGDIPVVTYQQARSDNYPYYVHGWGYSKLPSPYEMSGDNAETNHIFGSDIRNAHAFYGTHNHGSQVYRLPGRSQHSTSQSGDYMGQHAHHQYQTAFNCSPPYPSDQYSSTQYGISNSSYPKPHYPDQKGNGYQQVDPSVTGNQRRSMYLPGDHSHLSGAAGTSQCYSNMPETANFPPNDYYGGKYLTVASNTNRRHSHPVEQRSYDDEQPAEGATNSNKEKANAPKILFASPPDILRLKEILPDKSISEISNALIYAENNFDEALSVLNDK